MSVAFTPLLAAHVVVAVVGLGSILAVAIVSAAGRRATHPEAAIAALGPLLRGGVVSLAIMVVTGVAIDVAMRGAFQARWWFRLSLVLTVVIGAMHAVARRTVRQMAAAEGTALRIEHRPMA